MQIIAEVSKITKSIPYSLFFIFIERSETAKSFVKILLLFEIKNVAIFIKTHFFEKEAAQKCLNMRKRFILTRATNCQLLLLYQIFRFQNRNLWQTFQTLFGQKRGLAHLYCLYENESP